MSVTIRHTIHRRITTSSGEEAHNGNGQLNGRDRLRADEKDDEVLLSRTRDHGLLS